MRARSDQLQQKYEEIWYDYFEEGFPIPGLCSKYNMTKSGMKKVIQIGRQTYPEKEPKPAKRVDRRRTENRRPLSSIHLAVGVRVSKYMREKKINNTDFGVAVNMTRIRVSELQAGCYDPRITELAAIARVLDITMFELMASFDKAREYVR